MHLVKWIKRNPTEAVMILVGIGIAFLCRDEIAAGLNRSAITRSIAAGNQYQVEQQTLLQEKQKMLEPIAAERYRSGCEMVLSFDDNKRYKVLTTDSPVVDGNVAHLFRGTPAHKLPLSALLPAGSTVCDAYGNSSVLELNDRGIPVVKTIAATTNLDLVRQAMQRVRAQRAAVLK
jgi:hypothetical protein